MNSSNPTDAANSCPGCRGEAEPGRIEMDNNGPIVPCWICRREEWRMDMLGRAAGKPQLRAAEEYLCR